MVQRTRQLGENREQRLLAPLLNNSKVFYLFSMVLLVLIAWFLYVWYVQMTQGLGVTGLRTPVGAVWGVYIANFVFFVGIAHGGIAIAAGIRLFKLHSYQPVARIGEVLTVISIMMAGLSITIDMGRPDRIFNIVLFWPARVGSSPLSWDVTVIILYFTLSTSYLWLTLRQDMAKLRNRFSMRGLVYRLLLIGYKPGEEVKIEKMTWWLSIAIIFLVVMLSGGVVPWIFGLLPSRPGWYSALAGPYFLKAGVSSAIAAVLLVSAILRRVFHWEEYIKPGIFKGLGVFLGILTLFYVYLIFSEQLTMNFAAPMAEMMISDMILQGRFAGIFWPMLIFGFIGPAIYLIVQGVRPQWLSVTRTAIVTSFMLVAFWIKRFLIVVPSLLRPILPLPEGSYTPSWVEWSVVVGVLAAAILTYMLFLKIFPIIEVSEEEK